MGAHQATPLTFRGGDTGLISSSDLRRWHGLQWSSASRFPAQCRGRGSDKVTGLCPGWWDSFRRLSQGVLRDGVPGGRDCHAGRVHGDIWWQQTLSEQSRGLKAATASSPWVLPTLPSPSLSPTPAAAPWGHALPEAVGR